MNGTGGDISGGIYDIETVDEDKNEMDWYAGDCCVIGRSDYIGEEKRILGLIFDDALYIIFLNDYII